VLARCCVLAAVHPFCHRSPAKSVVDLVTIRPKNTTSEGRGPRSALKGLDLRSKSVLEVSTWVAEAWLDAILDSCSNSLPSLRSGLRAYLSFVDQCARCPIAHTVFV